MWVAPPASSSGTAPMPASAVTRKEKLDWIEGSEVWVCEGGGQEK